MNQRRGRARLERGEEEVVEEEGVRAEGMGDPKPTAPDEEEK